jgi:hypothetical protein
LAEKGYRQSSLGKKKSLTKKAKEALEKIAKLTGKLREDEEL